LKSIYLNQICSIIFYNILPFLGQSHNSIAIELLCFWKSKNYFMWFSQASFEASFTPLREFCRDLIFHHVPNTQLVRIPNIELLFVSSFVWKWFKIVLWSMPNSLAISTVLTCLSRSIFTMISSDFSVIDRPERGSFFTSKFPARKRANHFRAADFEYLHHKANFFITCAAFLPLS